MQRIKGCSKVVVLSAIAALAAIPTVLAEDLPAGVEQIIPRGQIAAIDSPSFVSAEDAEIADEAWVLGVVVEGSARAYSLNLLNRHEVVNDQAGGVAFAAVW